MLWSQEKNLKKRPLFLAVVNIFSSEIFF